MDYFIKQEGEDGEIEYVRAETIELDDTTFFADPRYKKVADSDVKRRQRIRELNQKLKDLEAEEPGDSDKTTPDPEPAVSQSQSMTPEQIIQAAIEAIEQKAQAKTQARQERQEQLKGLLEKHKLALNAMALLEQSTNPEATAELLGRSSLRFDDTTGGEVSGEKTDLTGTMANVYKDLGLETPQ